tara:strand:+ start:943 stop:1149 length:207 start_codon:yes stop_codon:yes gene_type:complete
MIKKLKSGDLAYYSRSSNEEITTCIILKLSYTDYEYYYKGGIPANYFSCLINGKVETICDIWLKKYLV